jgi:hypothetical protein
MIRRVGRFFDSRGRLAGVKGSAHAAAKRVVDRRPRGQNLELGQPTPKLKNLPTLPGCRAGCGSAPPHAGAEAMAVLHSPGWGDRS